MLAHTVAINLEQLLRVKILVEDQIRIVVQSNLSLRHKFISFYLSIYINKNHGHNLQQIE